MFIIYSTYPLYCFVSAAEITVLYYDSWIVRVGYGPRLMISGDIELKPVPNARGSETSNGIMKALKEIRSGQTSLLIKVVHPP